MMSIHILLLSNTDRFPYGSLICFSDPELQPPPVRAIHTLEWPLFLQRDYARRPIFNDTSAVVTLWKGSLADESMA